MATFDLKLFANPGDIPELVVKHPWLRGTQVRFEVNNVFNARPNVRDAAGGVPLSYQPGLLDPLGRTVMISLRKLFLPSPAFFRRQFEPRQQPAAGNGHPLIAANRRTRLSARAMSSLQPVRGTQSLLGEDADRLHTVIGAFDRVRRLYGFKRVEVPVIEHTAVFARTIGETTDVVSKEMYSFEDRGGEGITLRPEFTAGICRAYLSEGWQQYAPLKVATWGSAFRYERPQKGRFREFHQLDAEIIGAGEPQADVELLAFADQLLQGARDRRARPAAQHARRPETRDCLARRAASSISAAIAATCREDSQTRGSSATRCASSTARRTRTGRSPTPPRRSTNF